jgi:hypothetical protein
MTNRQFNSKIKRIFAKTSQDGELIDLCYDLWLENDLTEDQTRALDEIKSDAEHGQAYCAERYFLIESQNKTVNPGVSK